MDESRVDIISQLPDQNQSGDSQRDARIDCDVPNQKWEAYVPQVVSLGPIHYSNPKLAKGEDKKQWCKQYLPRSKDLPSFDKLVDDIKSDQVKKWYERQGNGRPKDERLGEMMALDGLFLLRFLREICINRRRKPPCLRSKPASHTFQPKSQIQQDIMKLENQIPFFVVNMVLQWESNTNKAFNSIVSRACNYLCPFQEMNFSHDPPPVTPDSHFLGFMYENIIRCSKEEKVEDNQKRKSNSTLEDSQKKKSSCTLRQAADLYNKGVKFMYENIIRCSKEEKLEDNQKKKSNSTLEDSQKKKSSCTLKAADLYSKGVKFKAPKRQALNEICFNDKTGTFYLPAIKMDSKTDLVMRNLLAYEALVHEVLVYSAKPEDALVHERCEALWCYIDLMERLIKEPEDVEVLIAGGIIDMHLSTNREVANVWNDMRKVLDQSLDKYGKTVGYKPIDTAVDGVTTLCDSKYRIWYLEFKKKYFSRPWIAAALIGGCCSLLLSLLQTILSLLQTILSWKQFRLQLKGM